MENEPKLVVSFRVDLETKYAIMSLSDYHEFPNISKYLEYVIEKEVEDFYNDGVDSERLNAYKNRGEMEG